MPTQFEAMSASRSLRSKYGLRAMSWPTTPAVLAAECELWPAVVVPVDNLAEVYGATTVVPLPWAIALTPSPLAMALLLSSGPATAALLSPVTVAVLLLRVAVAVLLS